MGKNHPYYGENMSINFRDFPYTMGFVAFSRTVGNLWGNPCISHMMALVNFFLCSALINFFMRGGSFFSDFWHDSRYLIGIFENWQSPFFHENLFSLKFVQKGPKIGPQYTYIYIYICIFEIFCHYSFSWKVPKMKTNMVIIKGHNFNVRSTMS